MTDTIETPNGKATVRTLSNSEETRLVNKIAEAGGREVKTGTWYEEYFKRYVEQFESDSGETLNATEWLNSDKYKEDFRKVMGEVPNFTTVLGMSEEEPDESSKETQV